MKKFLISLFVIFVVPTLLLTGVSYLKYGSWFRTEFKLDKKIHIIAVGPSTLSCALNDNHIKGFKNLSRLGTPYYAMLGPLKRFLDDNPQVDTVYVCFGRHAIYRYTGGPQDYSLKDLRDLLPFCIDNPNAEFRHQLYKNPNLYGAILNPELIGFGSIYKKTPKDFGFGFPAGSLQAKTALFNPHAHASAIKYDEILKNHGSNLYDYEYIMDNCATNLSMIEQAIDLCMDHNAVPILFCPPLYQFDKWFSMDGYFDYLKTLNQDLLVADYERFEFPDIDCYSDVHHLTARGADILTKHIAENGIKYTTMKEYVASMKKNPVGFIHQPK